MLLLIYILTMMSTPADQRPVLLFGEPGNTLIQQQLAILDKEKSGLADRDITLHIIARGDARYRTYSVDDTAAFTFILVGKDNTEKYRSHQLVTTEKLFALIDGMPMRKAEMRRRQ